jgi:hypothetical protein
VHGCAVELLQHGHHAKCPQEVEEIIQQGPFVQPVDTIDDLLAVQTPRHPYIIEAGDLPTQALRQVLRHFLPCLWHGPPLLEESGPQIKALAYVGISE